MTTLLAALLIAHQVTLPPVTAVKDKPFYRVQHSPSCANWRGARSGTGDGAGILIGSYRLWVRGYISGFNIYGPDPTGDVLGPASWGQVDAFIDAYCARHSSHVVGDAMRPLAVHFIKRRPQPVQTPDATPRGSRRAMVALTTTCEDWNEARANVLVRIAFGTFGVGGFLTAYNLWGPDPTGDVIGAGEDPFVAEWIDGWCRERPAKMMMGAIHPLIDHFAAERAAGRRAPGGKRPTDRLSPESQERR